jgi:hypothetical protein
MSSRIKNPLLFVLVAIPLVLVILGSLALSVKAVFEDMRVVDATSQILQLVGWAHSAVTQQPVIAFSVGEDIWDGLIHAGLISSSTGRTNAWNGTVRATALSDSVMRIESELPAYSCRRMALDFMGRHPSELGLFLIEAQSASDKTWTAIYPHPAKTREDPTVLACGKEKDSRLAMVFKIK